MKKITILSLSMCVFPYSIYSQVKEKEITSKNSKGKIELINFNETKVNSDDKSVNVFF